MHTSRSRRSFITAVAGTAAALVGKFVHKSDGAVERRPAGECHAADASPTASATTIYTFDAHARLIAVSRPRDDRSTP